MSTTILVFGLFVLILFLIRLIKQPNSSYTTEFNLFTENLKILPKFLFFKPYPRKVPTKKAEINSIRIDNSEALKYRFWWGDDKNEQDAVLNRIKSHLAGINGICNVCKTKTAVVGYYENDLLDYPDDVAFDKVTIPPRYLCLLCFINVIKPALTNVKIFSSIDYAIPAAKNGHYLFYFIDFG